MAARRRAWANDESGAKALLELGCSEDDLDACLDLRAAEPSRAATIDAKVEGACAGLGEIGKKLAACLRGRTSAAVEEKGFPAKLPLALALDLRAAHGPRLLAVLDPARSACKASASAPKVASLAGTPLENDRAFVDAAIVCEGRASLDADAARAMRDGETMSDDAVMRSLHDAILSHDDTLRVAAPAGEAEVGVWCPSRLVDDDHAADVWAKAAGDGGVTVVGTVHIAEPCWNAEARAARAKERAAVGKVFAPVSDVVNRALDKLARRCDEPGTVDPHKSPLAGDPLEKTAGVLSFEGGCVFGYRGFAFASPKPLNHPSSMKFITEVVQVSGHAMKVEAIKELPDRLELTLRRRDAQLVVGIKRP